MLRIESINPPGVLISMTTRRASSLAACLRAPFRKPSLIWSMSVFSLTTTIGPVPPAELVDGAKPAASTASKQLSKARRQLKPSMLGGQKRGTSSILLRRFAAAPRREETDGPWCVPPAPPPSASRDVVFVPEDPLSVPSRRERLALPR